MAGETIITVVGNLTEDASLRFTPSGAAVANWTVASTPRTFDRTTNEWKDGDTLFLRCSIWREAAENVAESLTRGTRVVVTGYLKPTKWEDKKTGETRYGMELQVEEVGPSLKYATAKVTKTSRNGGGGGNQGAGRSSGGGQGGGWGANTGGGQQAPDPWAQQPAAASAGGWGSSDSSMDTPPF